MKEKVKNDIEKVKKFLDHFKKMILTGLIRVYLKGKNIPIDITIGGIGSFTDQKSITIDISTYEAENLSLGDLTKIVKFCAYHEASHIRFTDKTEYEIVVHGMSDLWKKRADKEGIQVIYNQLYEFAYRLLNCICDGRIENILLNYLPGLAKLRDWYRLGLMWQEYDVDDEKGPLMEVFNNILEIATCGLYCHGFEDAYPIGTPIRDMVDRCIEPITTYISSNTVLEGEGSALEIAEIICPLVLDTFKYEGTEIPKDVRDKLDEERDDKNFGTAESTEIAENNKIVAILTDEVNTGEESNITPDIIINKRIAPSEKEISEEEYDITSAETIDSADIEEAANNDASDRPLKDNRSSLDKFEKLANSSEDFENSLLSRIEDISKELADDTLRDIEITNASIKASSLVEESNKTSLNEENITFLRNEGYLSEYSYIENKVFIPQYPNHMVPQEILSRGTQTRSIVENIISSQTEIDREDVYFGELNETSLGRFICGRGDIFKLDGEKRAPSMAVYITKDDSGSMEGHKEDMACEALSEIEEIFKPLVPLKITTFSNTSFGVIKEWDDREARNYSWDFHLEHSPYGGNDDALAIMNGAMQLLMRPEEKKLLIIISDGLPCCSPESVHKAVEWSRKQGIFIISFFIGDDNEVSELLPVFREMYTRYFCGVNPLMLGYTLVKFLRSFIEE